MKILKIAFWIFISAFIILPTITLADNIINNNGIEISREEYDNLIQVYSHEYIMTMNQTQYERTLDFDYDNIIRSTKYIATTYNPHLNLTTELELTEEQYENFMPGGYFQNVGGDSPRLNPSSTYYETTAKRIEMLLMGGSVYNYVTLTATWKYIPNTRSFDVIGFRGYGFSFRNGSQHGNQIYVTGGSNYNVINYSWNGTNIKKFNNGFGISMNIVDTTIDALQLIVECDVEPTMEHPSLFGSYQHAVSNLTLAQSQNYELGGGGLGNVFEYPYNISQKYDGMSGLIMNF